LQKVYARCKYLRRNTTTTTITTISYNNILQNRARHTNQPKNATYRKAIVTLSALQTIFPMVKRG